MNDRAPTTTLIVEDDDDTRANLRDILEMDGYRVDAVGTMREALADRDWSQVAVVILDRRLPDGSAEQLLPRLKELAPEADVIVATGHADSDGVVAALRNGASDYIVKPINADALRVRLTLAFERRRLAREKAQSDAAFHSLVEAAPSKTRHANQLNRVRADGRMKAGAIQRPFNQSKVIDGNACSQGVKARDCREPAADRRRGT